MPILIVQSNSKFYPLSFCFQWAALLHHRSPVFLTSKHLGKPWTPPYCLLHLNSCLTMRTPCLSSLVSVPEAVFLPPSKLFGSLHGLPLARPPHFTGLMPLSATSARFTSPAFENCAGSPPAHLIQLCIYWSCILAAALPVSLVKTCCWVAPSTLWELVWSPHSFRNRAHLTQDL